ncbi:hypothetical protein, partial [Marichromatium gracile]
KNIEQQFKGIDMAQYKHGNFLHKSDHSEYDKKYSPGTEAPNPGIYRCVSCGDEIGIAKGHVLPPQNHHQHAPGAGKIEWQLVVFAQQRK